MKKRTLKAHKAQPKALKKSPEFRTIRRGKLPKPLKHVGGPKQYCSDLIDVGSGYVVFFMWRNGETLQQSAFYAMLFQKTNTSSLISICHLHWHPSHKPPHLITPCGSDLDYTDRLLPQGHELNLGKLSSSCDPRLDQDRAKLIEVFCKATGIQLGEGSLI